MAVHREVLEIRTRGRGFTDVTRELTAVVVRSGFDTGVCAVFLQHTSASLVIQENADPSVLRDLESWLSTLAPESRRWEHDAEGPDDMPSHAKTAMTRTSETIPFESGRLLLGTWQAVYLVEHRASPHTRRLVVTVLGV